MHANVINSVKILFMQYHSGKVRTVIEIEAIQAKVVEYTIYPRSSRAGTVRGPRGWGAPPKSTGLIYLLKFLLFISKIEILFFNLNNFNIKSRIFNRKWRNCKKKLLYFTPQIWLFLDGKLHNFHLKSS